MTAINSPVSVQDMSEMIGVLERGAVACESLQLICFFEGLGWSLYHVKSKRPMKSLDELGALVDAGRAWN